MSVEPNLNFLSIWEAPNQCYLLNWSVLDNVFEILCSNIELAVIIHFW